MNYLDQLNSAQKQAVEQINGPLLVIAGAGAGKTRTIAYRILHLVKSGIPAGQILAITFTNKASKEMRERVEALLGTGHQSPETGPFVSTFHALGAYILRQNAQKIGLNKYFVIWDRDESISAIKKALRALDYDEKRFEPRKVLSAISKQKGAGVNLATYEERAQKEFYPRLVATVWRHYENTLHEQKALDFDDLLIKTAELLEKHSEILAHYQKQWTYFHVDEYQDTNAIQYRLIKSLADKTKNICVVGDIDQSIYGWRGADFTNVMRFEEDYPDAKVVLLEENYRSSQNILTAANQVISKNVKRKDKKLFTKNAEGEKITIATGINENEESKFVANRAQELIRDGIKPEEIAVLYRANFQSRALEEALLKAGLPYQVLGVRFFERREIKDLMSYLRYALNPDDIESFKRASGAPGRGIGPATIAKIFSGQEESLPAKMRQKISDLQQLFAEIKQKTTTAKPSELIKFVLQRSGLEQALKEGSEDDLERLENLRELVTLAIKYDSLEPEDGLLALLTETSLASDQDELKQNSGIRLMTVHASKGLEFDCVFVTGLEQDLFPHRAIGGGEDRDDEEERRLFYVAITRARKKLYLTYAQTRTIFGSRQVNMPSEFMFDIDEELLDAENIISETNYLSIDF